MRRFGLVLSFLFTLVVAAPAGASTVSVFAIPTGPGHAPTGVSRTVELTGGDGERNVFRVDVDPRGVTVHDDGAPLLLSSCRSLDDGGARCELADAGVSVQAGDQDDRVVVSGTARSVGIDGGPGDDHLTSSAPARFTVGSGDVLEGSRFADAAFVPDDLTDARVDLGGGFDVLTFSAGFRHGVRVDLASATAQAGMLLRGIEGVVGTWKSDDLRGDDGPNLLDGGGAASAFLPDRIEARGGDDAVRAFAVGNTQLGGGDDVLAISGWRNGGKVDCGAGHDELALVVRTSVRAGCEAWRGAGLRVDLPRPSTRGRVAVRVSRAPASRTGAWGLLGRYVGVPGEATPLRDFDLRVTAAREDSETASTAVVRADRAPGRRLAVAAPGRGRLTLALRVRRRVCRSECGRAARLELFGRG